MRQVLGDGPCRSGDVEQLVECLLKMHRVLGLSPSTRLNYIVSWRSFWVILDTLSRNNKKFKKKGKEEKHQK